MEEKELKLNDRQALEELKIQPLGCGDTADEGFVWLRAFVQALNTANSIDRKITRSNVKKLAGIVNDITSKYQDLILNANYFYMSTFPEIIQFNNVCHRFCDTIKHYSDEINRINNPSSRDRDKLTRFFETILFYHENNFTNAYNEAVDALKRRKKFSKKFIFNGDARRVSMNILSKMWEFKIYIYIAYKLFYNAYIYVFPYPVQNMFDKIIQIFALVCFTFTSDPVAIQYVLKFINKIITLIGIAMYMLVKAVLDELFSKRFLQFLNIVMSYTYTYYCFGWLSKILVSICSTITILSPYAHSVVYGGESTVEYFKEIAQTALVNAKDRTVDVSVFIVNKAVEAIPAILEGMTVLFSNLVMNYGYSIFLALKNAAVYKVRGMSTGLTSILDTVFSMWRKKSKEIIILKQDNGVDVKRRRYNSVHVSRDIVKLLIPEIEILVTNSQLNKELKNAQMSYLQNRENSKFDIEVTDEDDEIDLSGGDSSGGDSSGQQVAQIIELGNELSKFAIVIDDEGQFYFDPNVLRDNIAQNIMPEINLTKVLNATKHEIYKQSKNRFLEFYDKNLQQFGLSAIVTAMSQYTETTTNMTQPFLILFFLGSEQLINEFVNENMNLCAKIILVVSLISMIYLGAV